MNTLDLDQELNTMIIQGKSVEAFHKFYAEDVVAQENDDPVRVGRDAWMRGRQEMEKNIKKFSARHEASRASSPWPLSASRRTMPGLSVRRRSDGQAPRVSLS